jgi:general stress protein 26
MVADAKKRQTLDKIWGMIKAAHSALLITVDKEGRLSSRPMGCIQNQFDGRIWFLTFADSAKVDEIADNDHVLISYANPSKYEYVSLRGRAEVQPDRAKINELWSEAFRVWFPSGPDDPALALLAVDVEEAKYWTNAASAITYAWAYVKAQLFGRRATPGDVAEIDAIKIDNSAR